MFWICIEQEVGLKDRLSSSVKEMMIIRQRVVFFSSGEVREVKAQGCMG